MKRPELFIFSLALATAHGSTVTAPDKEVKVARGNNVTLRCEFRTAGTAESGDFVYWRKIQTTHEAITRYFDGFIRHGASYKDRIYFSGNPDTGDLSITLTEVTMDDNGTYVCGAHLRMETVEPAHVALLVLVAPSIPDCAIHGTPEYGQTVNLTCNSREGSPKPVYTWKSFNMQNQPQPLQATEGQQITLKNVSAETSGFYICTSTNSIGHQFCNITVNIMPPSMNFALYAGVIGGVVAAIIVIGILGYCCCCRTTKDKDYEMTEREDRTEEATMNQEADEGEEDNRREKLRI
ncbi:PREDICTED: cell surface A33 antigen isoform X1 [Gavialis gangeticus]|uniref:cell surface A33 antigen isoform X1 n=1 Tax=Gavialis gangeticus TaxID=94835 RepID=UPI00092F0AE2|nr:PREDICTED: cell surface A33 antigen isoform X1 [Gavialis gangeticus]